MRSSCEVFSTRLVPRRYRRPYGIFVHSIEAWGPLSLDRLDALRGATVILANSGYTETRIAARYPAMEQIRVCHLALECDREKFPFGRAPLGQMEPALTQQIRPNSVLIVGRIMRSERHKGHDELLRAWPLVQHAVPDAQLVVVGGGDDLDRCKKLATELGLDDAVLFMGRVSDADLDAIYSRVALFAMPSRAEGFGVVYLEAMAHSLACIASIHDAAGEIVVDGETGFLVDQDDLTELALKLVTLLANPSLRTEFGQRGYDRLQSQFSFKQFESRMTNLLALLQG